MLNMTPSVSNIPPEQSWPANGHPDQAGSQATSSSPVIHHPGRLKGEITLALHTVVAQKLWHGFRRKTGLSGLAFSARMAKIWEAARLDDPYADWVLLNVYDRLMQNRHAIKTAVQRYQNTLQAASAPGFQVQPFASEQPRVETLWFKTPYGYLMAGFIAEIDALLRIAHTAERIGVRLDTSADAMQQAWIQQCFALYRLSFQWQPLGISRIDFQAKRANPLVQAARDKWGEIPASILSKALRAPLAPTIDLAQVEQQRAANKKIAKQQHQQQRALAKKEQAKNE